MRKTKKDHLRNALTQFVKAIEATGGVQMDGMHYVPVADIDWIDLGEAYVVACRALHRRAQFVDGAET